MVQQPWPETGPGARWAAELSWEVGSCPRSRSTMSRGARDGPVWRHHQLPVAPGWPHPSLIALLPTGGEAGDHPARLPPNIPKNTRKRKSSLSAREIQTNIVPEKPGREPMDEMPCCTVLGNMVGDENTLRWWWGSRGTWSQGQHLVRCRKHSLHRQP